MRVKGVFSQKLLGASVLSFLFFFGQVDIAFGQPESFSLSKKIGRKQVECRINSSNQVVLGYRTVAGRWRAFSRANLKQVRTSKKRQLRELCRQGLGNILPRPTATTTPNPTSTLSPPTSTPTPEPTSMPRPPTGNENSPVGTNLSPVTYYSSEMPFVDAMKSSSTWGSLQYQGGVHPEPLDLDAFGNVRSLLPAQNGLGRQIASKLIYSAFNGNYPAGRYILLYDGEGSFSYSSGAVRNASLSVPGRDVVDVTPTNHGISVYLQTVNSQNYPRNIRLIVPGGVCSEDQFRSCRSDSECDGTCEYFEDNYASQIFHPDFLSQIRYAKVLRFMDWMRTNFSTQSSWAGRPRVENSSWADARGVPLEIMIALANRLQADPWFCMPHLADDNYVREFAQLVQANLDSELTPHIEYSNETWNSAFAQAQYVMARGVALSLAPDAGLASLRFYSRRALEIFAIWEDVFGNASQLKRILASQASNSWTGLKILEWQNAYLRADALAIAPYFGNRLGAPNTQNTVSQYTLTQLFDVLENSSLPEAIGHMESNAVNTRNFGVEFMTYEGGQHIAGVGGAENNPDLTALFIAANRDPRMGDLYRIYLSAWHQAGGGMFLNFNSISTYNKWGSWGVLEYQSQDPNTAPKYQALMDYIAQRLQSAE